MDIYSIGWMYHYVRQKVQGRRFLGTSAALTFALSRAPTVRRAHSFSSRHRRKMNEEMEATRIPLHDVPVALVVESITREKMAVSAAIFCYLVLVEKTS